MTIRYRRAVDLVELTGILQTSANGLSIDEIAESFGVSRRTAERMLSALRERFPELRSILRGGRKFWQLPSEGRARPLQLPRTLDALSERIAELEAEIARSREEIEELRGLTEGVFSTAPVGILALDAGDGIVYLNQVLRGYLGVSQDELLGSNLRTAVRRRLADRVRHPERTAAELVDHASDGRCSLHVRAWGDRPARELWVFRRPIESGRFAGGWILRFVEAAQREPAPPDDRKSSNTPLLRQHLQTLKDAASEVFESKEMTPEIARRLASVVQAQARTIGTSLEMLERNMVKFEPFSPALLLDSAQAFIRPFTEMAGIELTVEVDEGLPAMRGDRALVLSNLVLNAKITLDALPRGTRLLLRAEHFAGPSRIRVSIVDDGPSLPEDFPEILSGFAETPTGGSGIGVMPARDASGQRVRGVVQYFELAADARPQA